MSDKVFSKEAWGGTLQGLEKDYRIFVPAKDGDFHSFRRLKEGVIPDFDFFNTRLSPKGILYPQSERMFEYTLDENDAEAHILKETPRDQTNQAIVGIRPCDARAFQIVQKNFDNPEFRDPWWCANRESTTLVGLGCNDPLSTCFCTSVGGGPFDGAGLDVLLYDLGNRYLARPLTEKGEAFLEKAPDGTPADKDTLKEAEVLKKEASGKIPATLRPDDAAQKPMMELFDAPFWEDVSFPCLNCGTCTYLCPTCWCFDIQDEVLGKKGERIRNWDSCMFPLFTLHGSGHNPREQKVQRVRQRFMHKLKYYVDKYHEGVQCTGCGRCVRFCPGNVDIRQVIELMCGI